MKLLGFIVLVLVWTCLYIVLGGIILKDFWEWFILPVFPLLPALTIKTAAGLSFIVGHMCKYIKLFETEEEKKRNKWEKIFVALTLYPFLWGCGYLLHLWVG